VTSRIGGSVRIDFERDWDRKALGQTEARRAVEQATDAAVGSAKALAPFGQGDYRESIKAIVESVNGIWHGTVYSTDFKANWIERGAVSPTYTTPAVHPLQRGIEAQGINVTPGA